LNLLTLNITASAIFGKVWTILFAILFFGVIIALHEFGHFITAKLFGVKVNEFAIGMGPKLFSRQKGETRYSLRLFPIGGFCALEGEDEADENEPRAFGNQKKWKRFIILAAGATLNILLGMLLVCIMLGITGATGDTVIEKVGPSMTEIENGVHEGDKIISIDGGHIFSARDLYYSLYRGGETYDIVVKRDGKKLTLEDVPVIYDTENNTCSFIAGAKKITALNLIPTAVTETCSMGRLIWLSLIDMFSGQYGLKDISGPVGTINMVAESAQIAAEEKDFTSVLFILAFITINIGMVNLLPLPALDGGRLFFIVVEAIFRKPIPKKFEAVVHAAGLVLLLALMAVITFSDIFNLFNR